MDKDTAYKKIIDRLSPLFDELKLKKTESEDGDIYVGEQKSVKIFFDDSKNQFVLSSADTAETGVGEFSAMSSWLFANDSTEKDVNSIANDFEDTCKALYGCKSTEVRKYDMPRASAGKDKNPEALSQKLLAYFPTLKNDYAEHMEKYNEFYYIEFFEDKVNPEVCRLLDGGDKKKISKFLSMLNEMYVEGTKETTAAVAYTILGGVGAKDPKYREILSDYLKEYQYLKLVMPYVFKIAEKENNK